MIRHHFLWLVVVSTLFTSNSYAFDLVQVFELAKNNDPIFLSEKSAYQAELELLPQARALLLPNISASFEHSRSTDTTLIGPGTSNEIRRDSRFRSTGYSLLLNQPLYNRATFAALQQAGAKVRLAAYNFAYSEQDLILRVAELYFGLLRAEVNLDLAVAEKTAIYQQLQLAQARLEVGLTTVTEVHEAKARYEISEAREIETKNKFTEAQDKLFTLTSLSIENVNNISSIVNVVTKESPKVDQWVKSALSDNFKIKAKKAEMEIAFKDVKIKSAGHFPTLDLVGSSSRRDSGGSSFSIASPDEEFRRETNRIGLELNLPLYRGGLIRSQTREARQRYQAASHSHEQQLRETKQQTRSAYFAVSRGWKLMSALYQAVEAGERVVDTKSEGYKAGINTNLDVLDAQKELYRAKRDYADARYSYVINILLLQQAAGSLTFSDLERVNGWLVH